MRLLTTTDWRFRERTRLNAEGTGKAYPAGDAINMFRIQPRVGPVSKQAENRSIGRHTEEVVLLAYYDRSSSD